ncbi:MAG TPA: multicopper oxidase domain-containing protein, partial [Anaerolineales bacterium]|nr:multicopper oxidase domain-containing protein [Anaerolineales bacterium]
KPYLDGFRAVFIKSNAVVAALQGGQIQAEFRSISPGERTQLVNALKDKKPLKANVGESIRIFFGVGGPNFTSSFHVIGEIFDRVYDQASLTSAPLTNVQTTLVPPGGATMVEFNVEVPGNYILVDHALSRLQRGLAGVLIVEGDQNPEIYNGVPSAGSGH